MKKRAKSFLALLLAVVMVLSSAGISYAAPDETSEPASEETAAEASQSDSEETAADEASPSDSEEAADEGDELELEDLDASTLGVKKLGEIEEDEGDISPELDTSLNETVRVSIFLEAPATLDAGYSAQGVGTNAGAISYRNALKANQAQMTAVIESAIGYSLNVRWNMTLLANAISGYVKVKDIPVIERLDGVRAVLRETRYEVPTEPSTAQPNTTHTSSGMVGAATAWSAGYTGAGMRIAIIDTGIDYEHQSFSEAAFNYAISTLDETPALLTQAEVNSVASQLNVSGSYFNAKIPYAFNYVDNNTNIGHLKDRESEHGSHVAGIAAANRYIASGSSYVDAATSVYAVGMAPDAQLIVMKVFGEGGGAYDSDYMVAIEDAIVLGCDSCNLSLGSGAQGFTYAASQYYQSILNGLASKDADFGMVVSISAGNSSSITSELNTDLFIDDVSMHTGGSPGTYINSLCVASADNIGMTGKPLVYNGNNIYYNESSSSGAAMTSIAGTYEFVYIDSIGNPEDYSTVNEEISLSGKILIVNRGDINFSAKGNNAISYSPKAVVVANSQPGTLSMNLDDYTGTFPMVLITLADANIIKASAAKQTIGAYTCYTGTITVNAATTSDVLATRNEAGVSSFSSWGVPGSLLMKPEITAPGGDIYSVFGTSLNNKGIVVGGSDQYELMSGTSMAAPHIAGLSAVLAQYLKEEGITVSGYSRRALMQSLLMSTATPMKNGSAYYSILQQGAGLADVSKAISARSAIFMTDAGLTSAAGAAADGKVKVELGDDPDKSGSYSYSFRIYNLTNETVTFDAPATNIFTQGSYNYAGYTFMDEATISAGSQTGYSWIPSIVYSNPYDVNKDGTTNDQDAKAILDYLTGEVDGASLDLTVADFDENGSVTTYDAYQILEYLESEHDAAVGCYVPANGYADVTVSFSFSVDNSIYTSGAYIEGFTYVTEKSGKDGAEGVQHTIPILGFYGSWTDPSMFDNTSYNDVLYGTVKYPYSGNYYTNYMTTYYNGVHSVFTGNPYMVEEDGFPTERLAINSKNNIGLIYYNLYRSAGTVGLGISKLDKIGGKITEVLEAQRTKLEVSGLWYNQSDGTWQNTAIKSIGVERSASDYKLEEGDVFRVGYYALPEYYGMMLSSDLTDVNSGVIASDAGFAVMLQYGPLGDGAYIGYDFTVDNTDPEIASASLSGDNLTVKASDNQNLAYVAILSLDGETVYAEEAPAKGECSVTFDVSNAIENANGYVAVFVADYAGNEVAKAVKVNDNVETEETVYVLTDTLASGKKYLIVSSNTAGEAIALGHDGTAVEAYDVEVNAGTEDTDNVVFIKAKDADESTIWTVDGDGSYSFENDEYYLSYSGRSGSYTPGIASAPTSWSAGADTLYARIQNGNYYLNGANGTWTMSSTSSNVYFYVEDTITYTVDPNKISSIELSENSLDLYKGNVVNLRVDVLPLTVEDRTVSWTSSDTSVATVDENGKVTAVAAGTATITATCNANSSMSASCAVKVTCIDKALNGIIWDEEGEVYFSSFNTNSLPSWTRNHSDGKGLQLASAFVKNSSTLYAGTLDTSTAETELYTVNPTTYELTDYGTNYLWASDIAIGATSYPYSDYIGMAYTYAYVLAAGPIEPGDDGEGGVYSGLPYAFLNCGSITGGAYFAGIAVKARSTTGGTYYVLDENGVIWETTLGYNNTDGFVFSTPKVVFKTGIATSFLYQNLYYDGTYLYWSHYDSSNLATLYIIDLDNDKLYEAGNFGDDVWPATGMYVNGSVAPASDSEIMDDGASLNVDLSGLQIKATRDQLMTPEIQARFAAEAARFATKVVTPAEEPEEEPTEPAEEDPEEPTEPAEEDPEEPTEPAEEDPEEPTEPAEEDPEEPTEPADEDPEEPTEPADEDPEEPTEPADEAPVEEPTEPVEEVTEPETEAADDVVEPAPEENPDPNYMGSVNAVGTANKVKRPVRNASSIDVDTDDSTVQVEIFEKNDTHNGLYTVSYDPTKLAYVETESDTAIKSIHVDEEKGIVTFAFATTDAESFAANEDIAVMSFELNTVEETTVTVATLERDNLDELTDEEEQVIPNTAAFEIAGANMTLGNDLSMNFFVKKAGVDMTKDYIIRITKTYADGRGDEVIEIPSDEWTDYNRTYYSVKFPGVSAKEMNDPIYVQGFYADGKVASPVWEDSIAKYAKRIFDNQGAEAKRMLADMLNYGAAAQTFFKYDASNLANNVLTDEQKAYATESVSVEDYRIRGENYYGSNLNLGNNLQFSLFFTNITPDMNAVVSFTKHTGVEQTMEIKGSKFELYNSSKSIYRIYIEEMVVADARQLITCTVYDADGTEVASASDSIESYIARMASSDALYETIMKFADSAYAYLHRND